MRSLVLALAVSCGVFSVTAGAQEFEAATIKRNTTPASASLRTLPTGEVIASNVAIRFTFSYAYEFDELAGAPSWVSDFYDVHVKPPEGATPEQRREMWRALLASRMKLAAHYEPREVPAYALVVARADGRLGPQLTPATLDCSAAGTQRAVSPSRDEALKHCELLVAPGLMASGSVLIERMTFNLGAAAGRPVTDATGLTGRYSVALTYSTPPPPGSDRAPGGTPDAPEIFTALQEQLGLKLQPSTKTIRVLVIDHVERPTEN